HVDETAVVQARRGNLRARRGAGMRRTADGGWREAHAHRRSHAGSRNVSASRLEFPFCRALRAKYHRHLNAQQGESARGIVRAPDRAWRQEGGRMNAADTLTALGTITRREVTRILRIWTQTLLPPAITMTLYFIIFGSLIGRRIGEIAKGPDGAPISYI